jgi:predicted small metal-binding protein
VPKDAAPPIARVTPSRSVIEWNVSPSAGILRIKQPSFRRDEEAADVSIGEDAMGRKFIDCREFPSEMNCSVAIMADTESELLEAAVQHAVAVHGHQDTPELRDQIRSAIKDGMPPAEAPSRAA